LTNDYILKKYKKQGIRLTWASGDSSTYGIYKTVSLDLSTYADGTVTNTTRDYVGVSFYVSDTNMYSSSAYCMVLFATVSGVDSFHQNIDSSNCTLVQGWNSVILAKNDFIETGSPD
jgi:hypothetical protein